MTQNNSAISSSVTEKQNFTAFQCIKIVHGFKIRERIGNVLYDANDASSVLTMSPELEARYDAYVKSVFNNQGESLEPLPFDYGYYVRYEDGYESFSPSVPFENGYLPIKKLTGAGALNVIKSGKFATRDAWDGKIAIALFGADQPFYIQGHSFETHPYFMALFVDNGTMVPWECTATDLLADDWSIYELPDIDDELTEEEGFE